MTKPEEMLSVLETQMMGLAASASAAASMARMVRLAISGGGMDSEDEPDRMASGADEVIDKVVLPRTFGDGRGAKRKPTTEE